MKCLVLNKTKINTKSVCILIQDEKISNLLTLGTFTPQADIKPKQHRQYPQASALGKACATRHTILCSPVDIQEVQFTKAAPLKIIDDMFETMDLGRSTILFSLDLSVTFDAIENDKPFRPAEHTL